MKMVERVWVEVEEKMGKKIRGLRLCQTEDCMIPLNRDKNGATNIGTNFTRSPDIPVSQLRA
jgi:hypothetical protein